MSDPIFTYNSTNPFGLSDVGSSASPTFVDIDNDGDVDAFVGEWWGNTMFFRNTGTASNPAFATPIKNSFGLSNIDVGTIPEYHATPTFVDIDGDGDLDAFVGNSGGYTMFFRNTGTASNPAFAEPTRSVGGMFNGRYVMNATPTLVDIDGDGDLDAFVGNVGGYTMFFRNTGTASNPAFAAPITNPFGLSNAGRHTNPALVDIDGDGDLDAFVNNGGGDKLFFRNTGTASNPVFAAPITNPFGLSTVDSGVRSTFVDIDNDGDLDAFVGDSHGNTLFFTNSASVGTHVPKPEDPDGKTASEIFVSVLSDEEKKIDGAEEVGMIRVMADLSKAAYHLEAHEENSVFNDEDLSGNADGALTEVINQGWQPLDLDLPLTDGLFGYTIYQDGIPNPGVAEVKNGLSEGFYNKGNAAAFVARVGDAVVISFRGTNDNRKDNPSDVGNRIHPDKDQWGSPIDDGFGDMADHYADLQPLIEKFDQYVLDNSSWIDNVYVTGHSLGGALAIEYMSKHQGEKYQSITFAAPAFTLDGEKLDGDRAVYEEDNRITQIEISEDPVPQTWDLDAVINTYDNNRPGNVIRFAGNQTLDEPDSHDLFKARDDNHSMDYYRQIVDRIDASSWLRILDEPGDQTVFLGGKQDGDNFFVDEGRDVLKDTALDQEDFDQIGDDDIEIFYGGRGDDELTGGNSDELMLGGSGNDSIDGNGGIDTAAYSGARTNYSLQLNERLLFADQRIVTDQRTGSGNDGIDTLENIERLIFTDSGLAFDLDGSAGMVAKLIGAVFGAGSVANTSYVAIGFSFLDSGTSYEDLATLAINAAGANSPEEVVTLLWNNVAGSPPTPDQIQGVLKDLGASTGKLGVYAADHSRNEANINLVGLVENGIVFDPLHYQPIG